MNDRPQSTYHVSGALFVRLLILLCSHTSLLIAEDATEHPSISVCICVFALFVCTLVCVCMFIHVEASG